MILIIKFKNAHTVSPCLILRNFNGLIQTFLLLTRYWLLTQNVWDYFIANFFRLNRGETSGVFNGMYIIDKRPAYLVVWTLKSKLTSDPVQGPFTETLNYRLLTVVTPNWCKFKLNMLQYTCLWRFTREIGILPFN